MTDKSENISVGLRIIPVPTKMILDTFRNNSGLVVFICEKQPKHFRQLRNISGSSEIFLKKIFYSFLQKNSRSYQNNSGTLQKYQVLTENLFGLVVHSETTFRFYRNYSGVLSPELFRFLRNLSGDFLSDSLSRIQQIDDP